VQPSSDKADGWRVGVRSGGESRFRYGSICGLSPAGSHAEGTVLYQIRYDDSQSVQNVDAALCDMDWVQPDPDMMLAARARKRRLPVLAVHLRT
jgi:hypothetical protein